MSLNESVSLVLPALSPGFALPQFPVQAQFTYKLPKYKLQSDMTITQIKITTLMSGLSLDPAVHQPSWLASLFAVTLPKKEKKIYIYMYIKPKQSQTFLLTSFSS
jgi:hypothetical protein